MVITFPFAAKNKSRDFFAALAESLELSLLFQRLAPILHLRREGKPKAAKRSEDAKSRHKEVEP
jgi:hypothetical protein